MCAVLDIKSFLLIRLLFYYSLRFELINMEIFFNKWLRLSLLNIASVPMRILKPFIKWCCLLWWLSLKEGRVVLDFFPHFTTSHQRVIKKWASYISLWSLNLLLCPVDNIKCTVSFSSCFHIIVELFLNFLPYIYLASYTISTYIFLFSVSLAQFFTVTPLHECDFRFRIKLFSFQEPATFYATHTILALSILISLVIRHSLPSLTLSLSIPLSKVASFRVSLHSTLRYRY